MHDVLFAAHCAYLPYLHAPKTLLEVETHANGALSPLLSSNVVATMQMSAISGRAPNLYGASQDDEDSISSDSDCIPPLPHIPERWRRHGLLEDSSMMTQASRASRWEARRAFGLVLKGLFDVATVSTTCARGGAISYESEGQHLTT